MKILIILYLQFLLLFAAYGQSSPGELGQKIFLAFKYDSINNINNYRLKIEELPEFFISNGLDTNTNQFKVYRSKYPDISTKLLSKCKEIETDTLQNGLSWKIAELQKITLKGQDGKPIPDQNKPGSKLLEIQFISKGNHFLILLETVMGTDKLWKVGNSITLFPSKREISD